MKAKNQTETPSASDAMTCSRIDGRGFRCGCRTIQYWLPDKARWSHKHPRHAYKPTMRQAHCSKCGQPIFANITITNKGSQDER